MIGEPLIAPLMSVALMSTVGVSSSAKAQDEGGPSLAGKAQNPIGLMIVIPFEFGYATNVGPDERRQKFMLFKPVVPFSFSPDWTFLARGIFPVLDNPIPDIAGGGRDTGIGDIQLRVRNICRRVCAQNTNIQYDDGDLAVDVDIKGPLIGFGLEF